MLVAFEINISWIDTKKSPLVDYIGFEQNSHKNKWFWNDSRISFGEMEVVSGHAMARQRQ